MSTDIVLKLDANEGRCVLDSEQLARVLSPEIARLYPRAEALEIDIARAYDLEPDQVLATAGADDAIDRAFRAFARAGSRVAGTKPGFVEFLDASGRIGAEFVSCFRDPGKNFPLGDFKALIDAARPAVAVVAAPDNPSGTMIESVDFDSIAAACASKGTIFLFDITYMDFSENASLVKRAISTPGVVVAASFSKSRGLAGFRAGWAMAGRKSRDLITAMRKAGPPFSLSSPAIEAARVALAECGERHARFVDRVRMERKLLAKALARLGAATWESQANFVTARVPDSAQFSAALLGAGILIRNWPGGSEAENLIRITCPGEEADFEYLIGTLENMEAVQWSK